MLDALSRLTDGDVNVPTTVTAQSNAAPAIALAEAIVVRLITC